MMMQKTQRLKWWIGAVVLLGNWLLLNAQTDIRASQASTQPTQYTSQALLFAKQVDELDPNEVHNRYKIFLVLRCRDVPVEQRKALALRILKGDYPNKPNFQWIGGQEGLFAAALTVLSHLSIDDASLLPFLEEYLLKLEQIARAQSDEELPADLRRLKERVPPPGMWTRALLIHLKAVQAVPEVKSAADLEKQLDVMLKEAAMTRQELKQLLEEFDEKLRRSRLIGISPRAGLAYRLVVEYSRTLFHYAKRGMDVESIAKSVDISAFAEAVRLGQEAADLPKLIDAILKNRIYDQSRGQLLVDEGVSVVPLIIQKLTWAKEHPKEVADTGMGINVLLDVLATLIGREALPYVEQFRPSQGEWTCNFTNRTKDWIERGYVFGFDPFL
jgi:hypothetical protein